MAQTPGNMPLGDLDVDVDSPPDGELDELPADDVMLVDTSVSCDNCAHQGVCAVYGNVQEMLGGVTQRTGGEAAFDAADLAIICDYYEAVE